MQNTINTKASLVGISVTIKGNHAIEISLAINSGKVLKTFPWRRRHANTFLKTHRP